MNKTQKTIALAIGGAFALSIAATSVNAASNPFTAKSLSSGYQVADAEMKTEMKAKDGKCSTGKCGANKKMTDKSAMAHEEKAKEGSCSADKAAMAHDKTKEGSCSADKAAMEKAPMEKTK